MCLFRSPMIYKRFSTTRASLRKTQKWRPRKFWSDMVTLLEEVSRRKPTTVARHLRLRIPAATRTHLTLRVSKRIHLKMPRGGCKAPSVMYKVPCKVSLTTRLVRLPTMARLGNEVAATIANLIPFNPKDKVNNRCPTGPDRALGPWVLPVNWHLTWYGYTPSLSPCFYIKRRVVLSDMHLSEAANFFFFFFLFFFFFSPTFYISLLALKIGLNATLRRNLGFFQRFLFSFFFFFRLSFISNPSPILGWMDGVGLFSSFLFYLLLHLTWVEEFLTKAGQMAWLL